MEKDTSYVSTIEEREMLEAIMYYIQSAIQKDITITKALSEIYTDLHNMFNPS